MKKVVSIFSLVVGLLFGIQFAFAYSSPGKPTGFVGDFANVFTIEQKNALEQKLVAFNASTTNEIAVVTIKSLDGDYIEHYAVELFKEWQIGKAKEDNGILLLVALEDHKMRIEVGYGLEGALTDALSAQIIRNDLTPAFKNNDFYGGIDKAIDDIIKATQGEYTAEKTKHTSAKDLEAYAIIIFFIGGPILSFIASILGRSKSWWAGGVLGAVLGGGATLFGLFGLSLLGGGIVTSKFVILGLIFDYIVSKTYTGAISSGSSISWWVGGNSGGWSSSSSSGSSFGGFSGGSSGGGGSSGSW